MRFCRDHCLICLNLVCFSSHWWCIINFTQGCSAFPHASQHPSFHTLFPRQVQVQKHEPLLPWQNGLEPMFTRLRKHHELHLWENEEGKKGTCFLGTAQYCTTQAQSPPINTPSRPQAFPLPAAMSWLPGLLSDDLLSFLHPLCKLFFLNRKVKRGFILWVPIPSGPSMSWFKSCNWLRLHKKQCQGALSLSP